MFQRALPFAILTASSLAFLVVQLDVSVVNVALNTLRGAFNTNLSGLQWVINSYSLVFSAFLILGGALGDKLGAKGVFSVGFGIFTVGSIGCGLAPGMATLIAMRCIQGAGAALLIPTSLMLIRLNFPDPDRRRSAVALWGACGGIALAAGPVVGGLLIQHVGWRSIFMINIPIGLLAIILTLLFTPASRRIDAAVDVRGQVTIAAALGLLTYGLTEVADLGWTAVPKTCLLLAFLFIILFACVEQAAPSPLLPARLVRNRRLIATMITGSIINLTFYGVVFVLSIYFQTRLHLDAVHTGLAFIPLTAVMTVSSLLSARIGRRLGAGSIMTFGLAIQAVGFLLLSLVVPGVSQGLLDGALVIVGIGSASTVPAMNNAMLASVSLQDAGMASGLMSSARQIGGIVGVAVFGILISASDPVAFTEGMSASMVICASAVFLCALMNGLLAVRADTR